jgi:hypothetical protein
MVGVALEVLIIPELLDKRIQVVAVVAQEPMGPVIITVEQVGQA